jgi:hypothetical protein
MAALSLALAAPTALADVPTGNLLVNPGAESDTDALTDGTNVDVDGWIDSGEFTAVRYDTCCGFLTPTDSTAIGGGSNFFAGGFVGLSTGTQVHDVSVAASEIDSGDVDVTLSGYLGGYGSQADNAAVTATFRDASANSLGTLTIGPVTPAQRGNTTKLLYRTATGAAPAGTRSIRVRQTMTRMEGTANDGYADNISLSLTDTSSPPPASNEPKPKPQQQAQTGSIRISRKPVTITAGGVAPVTVACPRTQKSGCRGTVTIELLPGGRTVRGSRRSRGRIVGRGRFSIRAGKAKRVRVRLSRHGRRKVLRRRRVRCKVSVAIPQVDGKMLTSVRTVTLRAPKHGRG